MKNSEKYFHAVGGYIEDMQAISGTYDRTVQRLEPFKGSAGYTAEMQKAQADLDSAVQDMSTKGYPPAQVLPKQP